MVWVSAIERVASPVSAPTFWSAGARGPPDRRPSRVTVGVRPGRPWRVGPPRAQGGDPWSARMCESASTVRIAQSSTRKARFGASLRTDRSLRERPCPRSTAGRPAGDHGGRACTGAGGDPWSARMCEGCASAASCGPRTVRMRTSDNRTARIGVLVERGHVRGTGERSEPRAEHCPHGHERQPQGAHQRSHADRPLATRAAMSALHGTRRTVLGHARGMGERSELRAEHCPHRQRQQTQGSHTDRALAPRATMIDLPGGRARCRSRQE